MQYVVEKYGDVLKDIAPVLYGKFERAARETAVEAAAEEDEDAQSSTSRANSSNNCVAISDAEFSAMLKEFGPDAPQPEVSPGGTTTGGGGDVAIGALLDDLERELSAGCGSPTISGAAADVEEAQPFVLRRTSRVKNLADGAGAADDGTGDTTAKSAKTEPDDFVFAETSSIQSAAEQPRTKKARKE